MRESISKKKLVLQCDNFKFKIYSFLQAN